MKRHLIPLVLALGLFCSCDRLDLLGFVYTRSETPDQRFTQSMQYNAGQKEAVIDVASDDYRLYTCTDVHVNKTTEGLDRFVSDYLKDDTAAPFAICLGDLIDAQNQYDLFMEHVEPIAKAGKTLFCTAGNHDIYFGQWKEYRSRLNTSTYCFVVNTPSQGKDLYICLDSASGTLGSKQSDWLESTLAQRSSEGFRNIIVFTHTHFFKRDASQGHTSNYTLDETYYICSLFEKYGVKLVLTGHDHSYEDSIYKNARYLIIDALADYEDTAWYAILTVGKGGANVERVKVR